LSPSSSFDDALSWEIWWLEIEKRVCNNIFTELRERDEDIGEIKGYVQH